MSALIDLMDAWLQAKAYNTNMRELDEYKLNSNPMKIQITIEFDDHLVKDSQVNKFLRPNVIIETDDHDSKSESSAQAPQDKSKSGVKKYKDGFWLKTTESKECNYCKGKYKPTGNAQQFCSEECKKLYKENNGPKPGSLPSPGKKVKVKPATNQQPAESDGDNKVSAVPLKIKTQTKTKIGPLEEPPGDKPNHYKEILAEKHKQEEEQREIDGLRDFSKIDWKKAKNPKNLVDNVSVL